MAILKRLLLISTLPWILGQGPAHAQSMGRAQTDSAYAALIINEVSAHPKMELRDLYKFVHQSAMGPGHAVSDTAGARRWLEREIATLDLHAGYDEKTVEVLRPDSGFVRVNLRPYLAAGGNAERLLQAFITTANTYHPSTEQLEHHWSVVTRLAQSGGLSFHADSALTLIEIMKAGGFPAVHHSSVYEEAYHPAYRVIQKDQAEFTIPATK